MRLGEVVIVSMIFGWSACATDGEPICRSNADCTSERCENGRCIIPEEECCTCLIGLTCIDAVATQDSCLDDIRNDRTSDFNCVEGTASGCGAVCGFLLPTDGERCFRGSACDDSSVCVDADGFEGREPPTCRAACRLNDETPCRVGTCELIDASAFACVPP